MVMLSLGVSKEVSSQDLALRSGDLIKFGSIKAKMIRFGGFATPECKLAISLDSQHFFFNKVGSTCKTLTNSKGVKIVCNRNKTVCKTRDELKLFIVNEADESVSQSASIPSWCSASRLNRTEHAICANETLSALDLKLAKVYGSIKADNKDIDQKKWLRKRNACKGDIGCIKQSYEERIAYLNEQKEQKHASESLDKTRFQLMQTLCRADDASSCVSAGVIYDEGKYGIALDDTKAIEYYRKGCNLGSAKGCAYLGLMYANGEGTGRDLKTALHFLEKGCSKGYDKACENASSVRNDLKNAFRGVSKSMCYRIKQYGPQRVCLQGTGSDACYGLKDYGLQRVCLNGAGTDACYGLKDYAMQRICQKGIRSDACYGLKNYNQQRSCQTFSGSTEFWLILAHYGYYTNR